MRILVGLMLMGLVVSGCAAMNYKTDDSWGQAGAKRATRLVLSVATIGGTELALQKADDVDFYGRTIDRSSEKIWASFEENHRKLMAALDECAKMNCDVSGLNWSTTSYQPMPLYVEPSKPFTYSYMPPQQTFILPSGGGGYVVQHPNFQQTYITPNGDGWIIQGPY